MKLAKLKPPHRHKHGGRKCVVWTAMKAKSWKPGSQWEECPTLSHMSRRIAHICAQRRCWGKATFGHLSTLTGEGKSPSVIHYLHIFHNRYFHLGRPINLQSPSPHTHVHILPTPALLSWLVYCYQPHSCSENGSKVDRLTSLINANKHGFRLNVT